MGVLINLAIGTLILAIAGLVFVVGLKLIEDKSKKKDE